MALFDDIDSLAEKLVRREEEIEAQRMAEHRCLICGKKLPKAFTRPLHSACLMSKLGEGDFARDPS